MFFCMLQSLIAFCMLGGFPNNSLFEIQRVPETVFSKHEITSITEYLDLSLKFKIILPLQESTKVFGNLSEPPNRNF